MGKAYLVLLTGLAGHEVVAFFLDIKRLGLEKGNWHGLFYLVQRAERGICISKQSTPLSKTLDVRHLEWNYAAGRIEI